MDAVRWQLLDGIFDAALELKPAARREFLREQCRGDAALQREIEGLLEAHGLAEDFIEKPAMKVAARVAANESQTGRQVGPYKIISLLGTGGMGEVYLAEDTRLARNVALKFLPPAFSADHERVRRFAKEARAASALNHPNIITIYDIGETGGAPYLAAEYIEGQTLRARLQAGRMPLKEALPIVEQIAAALAAAHQAGIAHRDIKPENIMLRPDGYVKVLDFGLAKLLEPARTGAASVSSMAETQPGLVLGTVNYMSPEQALGEKVDARTDIWSLGVVFYEMLASQHPFKCATQDSTFDAITKLAPAPLADSVADLPAGCEEVIKRALEKERELRFPTASAMGAELKRLQRELAPAKSVISTVRHPLPTSRRNLWLGFAALAVAAAAFSGWLVLSRVKGAKQIIGPDWSQAKSTQLTNQAGGEFNVSLAPDGKYFVYSSRAGGNWDIYAQRVGGRAINNLTKDSTADDIQPAYSPDGNYIAFRSERAPSGIYVMEATSENVRRVSDIGFNPAWSPDGKELVVSTDFFTAPVKRSKNPSELWIINLATGKNRLLSKGDAVQPSWSPNGARIAYWALLPGSGQRDLWTMPAKGGEPAQVTNDAALDWNPVWSQDGKHLYFASNRGGSMNFWRVAIDQNTGLTLEPPEAVVTPSAYSQNLSFSRDGKLLAYAQKSETANLYRASLDLSKGKVANPQPVTEGARFLTEPDLAPDEEWLVFSSQGEKQEDISLIKFDGTEQRQLTNDAANDRSPRWSPDGKRIAFYSDRSGRFEIWLINIDGTGLRQLTFTSGPTTVYPIWSPDGARMLYKQRGAQPFLFEVDKAWAEQTPNKLPLLNGLNEGFWVSSWSPDGNKLAGLWLNNERQSFLYIYDFTSKSYENLGINGSRPIWMSDGRHLLYQQDGNQWLADTQTRKAQQILAAAPDTIDAACPTRDNRTLFYTQKKTEADIWLWTLD